MSFILFECPICMDDIDVTKNCITTECGHRFHTSCVMRNVAHNGFGCPMCRTAMAEEPEEDSQEYEDEFSIVNDPNPDEYALRGFRMFMDNVEGVAHDREDELEELEDEAEPAKPSAAYITQKLQEQGTTMEDLVKIILRDHEEYEAEDEEFDRVDERVWGEMRIIIDNYELHSEVDQPPQVEEEPLHPNITIRQNRVQTPVTTQAEEKPPSIRQRRPGIAPHLDSISRVLFASDEMEE